MIDTHNGKIDLESEPGKGSTFTSAYHELKPGTMAKAKVLLAEDDLSLGFVIKDSLQDVDFEVTHCPDE